MAKQTPRIFISYSHDSTKHTVRVLALADRLREDGLDCVLDQYEPAPPQGWPRWMEEQLERADFILVVSTAGYRHRACTPRTPEAGHGVRFESVLLVQELYEAGMWNERFVPVLFSDANEEDILRPLRGYTTYDVSTERGYEALYRRLTSQPLIRRPEIGTIKTLTPNGTQVSVTKSGKEISDDSEPDSAPLLAAGSTPWWKNQRLQTYFIASTLAVSVTIATFLGTLLRLPEHERSATPVTYSQKITREALKGGIRDAETNSFLAGVEVILPEYGQRQITDEMGRYHFGLEVPSGTRVTLRATLQGYQTIERDPMVGGNDTWKMHRIK